MSAEEKTVRSPWLTVWFSPRRTVERLVATRPTYFVWPLAILGAIASFYSQISVIDSAGYLLNWQLALSLLLFGALVGTVWLYLSGFMLSWIGGLLGGRASALHMRTVFAWSTLPTILGFVIILVIATTAGRGGALRGAARRRRAEPRASRPDGDDGPPVARGAQPDAGGGRP